MWGSITQVGTAVVGSLFASSASRATARAEREVAAAHDLMRQANNMTRVSRNSLAATVRGINNQRTMEGAGKNWNAASTNMQRMMDSFTKGNFEAVIQSAEYAGALAASNASAGVSGASTQAAEYSAALRIGRGRVAAEEAQGQALFDAKLAQAGIMSDAFMSLERGGLPETLDLVRVPTPTNKGQSWMSGIFGAMANNTDALHTLLGSLGGDSAATAGESVPLPPWPQATAPAGLGTQTKAREGTPATAYPVTGWNYSPSAPLTSTPRINIQSNVRGL